MIPAAEGTPLLHDPIAEWIFNQHARRMSCNALYAEALSAQLGEFRKAEFVAAYGKVYVYRLRFLGHRIEPYAAKAAV
jgi:hypothetical protein